MRRNEIKQSKLISIEDLFDLAYKKD